MNLRDIRYFIVLAKTRHFGRAAAQCFVSQPTLSGQIKKLEQELDVVLFERTNRQVHLSEAGEKLLPVAQQVMEQAERLKQTAAAIRDPLASELRLGVIPTISPYLMPLLLGPLREKAEKMPLVISEEKTDRLLERLEQHEIDAAILATEHPELELKRLHLYREPFWIAFPQSHPFYFQQEISQQDLDDAELLLLSEGHCLAQQAMQACNLQTHNNRFQNLRAASLETLVQLVGAGYGVTLVPALALHKNAMTGRGVITRPLNNLENTWRDVYLYYRAEYPRKQALQLLRDTLIKELPNTLQPETHSTQVE